MAETLVSHIRCDHNMASQQYQDHFNVGETAVYHPKLLAAKSERIAGEHNPGYQHGGTMSSYSKKYIQYEGLSDEEKEARIAAQARKLVTTRIANHNDATKIEYYIERGLNEEETRAALAERQSTFSLEKCIEKYGEEEGYSVWCARQQKWQATLDALPDEEKQRIYDAKVAVLHTKISKIANDCLQQFLSGCQSSIMVKTRKLSKFKVERIDQIWYTITALSSSMAISGTEIHASMVQIVRSTGLSLASAEHIHWPKTCGKETLHASTRSLLQGTKC